MNARLREMAMEGIVPGEVGVWSLEGGGRPHVTGVAALRSTDLGPVGVEEVGAEGTLDCEQQRPLAVFGGSLDAERTAPARARRGASSTSDPARDEARRYATITGPPASWSLGVPLA